MRWVHFLNLFQESPDLGQGHMAGSEYDYKPTNEKTSSNQSQSATANQPIRRLRPVLHFVSFIFEWNQCKKMRHTSQTDEAEMKKNLMWLFQCGQSKFNRFIVSYSQTHRRWCVSALTQTDIRTNWTGSDSTSSKQSTKASIPAPPVPEQDAEPRPAPDWPLSPLHRINRKYQCLHVYLPVGGANRTVEFNVAV